MVPLMSSRPAFIMPVEVAEVRQVLKQHASADQYRIATKHEHVEIYENIGPDFDARSGQLQEIMGWRDGGLPARLKAEEKRYAHYTPVLRFTLIDPAQRWFSAKRMCYRRSVDGPLDLSYTGPGPIAELAQALIPTLLHRKTSLSCGEAMPVQASTHPFTRAFHDHYDHDGMRHAVLPILDQKDRRVPCVRSHTSKPCHPLIHKTSTANASSPHLCPQNCRESGG